MNGVQIRLKELQDKGWTLASIAREIGQKPITVESWKADKRFPASPQLVLAALDELAKRKRIPKKKFYAKGSRQTVTRATEEKV